VIGHVGGDDRECEAKYAGGRADECGCVGRYNRANRRMRLGMWADATGRIDNVFFED